MRFIFFLLIFLSFVFIYTDFTCPYNFVNDSFPGKCGRYIDTNHDSICDYSQNIETANINSEEYIEHTNEDNDSVYNNSQSIEAKNTINNKTQNNKINNTANNKKGFIVIFIIWVLINTVFIILKKLKKVSLKNINIILNFSLLTIFIFVFISSIGIILTKFSILKSLYITFIKIHFISGTIMLLLSVNHIILKIKYYKYCIKGNKKRCEHT